MKILRLLLSFIVISTTIGYSYARADVIDNKLFTLLTEEREISRINDREYNRYDFTASIADTSYAPVIGIIGKEYQRLLMQIDGVSRSSVDGIYNAVGVSETNGNRCDFMGEIKLVDIYEYQQLDYGVDEEYKTKGLRQQGFAVFEYTLKEKSSQRYSGNFTGKLYLRWYKKSGDVVYYDDINVFSDNYVNNIYYGTWRQYGKKTTRMASWADFKLPEAIAPDLNIGAGEFSPNPKYFNNGWRDYSH